MYLDFTAVKLYQQPSVYGISSGNFDLDIVPIYSSTISLRPCCVVFAL
jgi:hypothetical protein